jgi:hypothetical protein
MTVPAGVPAIWDAGVGEAGCVEVVVSGVGDEGGLQDVKVRREEVIVMQMIPRHKSTFIR